MSEWDMMKYSKTREGLSIPQIYLKLRGAWTGGTPRSCFCLLSKPEFK